MLPSPNLGELLAYPGRSTRALVDLDVIRANAHALTSLVGPAVELMAVVKADGYGHGAVMVAREAIAGGATWLGVATVSEGRELRDASIDTSILVLGPIHATEVDAAMVGRLDISVGDHELADALAYRAETGLRIPPLHLKVDTGMHRYGLPPDAVVQVLSRLEQVAPGAVVGLCSHLASADEAESAVTLAQARVFGEVTDRARPLVPGIKVHLANSAATMSRLAQHTSIARVGIALYGCGLVSNVGPRDIVRPAMSIVSRVMRTHELKPGDGVSYGHTYTAISSERVGLVPVGYADGYQRSLSNRSAMTVDGVDLPVRGRVCMDQTVVGSLPASVSSGDWVGVVGPALDGPSWDDLATIADTISYELLTSVGRRVARLYHRSGTLVAVRDERGRYASIDEQEEAPSPNSEGLPPMDDLSSTTATPTPRPAGWRRPP